MANMTHLINRTAWCVLWPIGMVGAVALMGCDWLDRRDRK